MSAPEAVWTGKFMRYTWDEYRKQFTVQVVGASGAVLQSDYMDEGHYLALRAFCDARFGIAETKKRSKVEA